MFEILLNHYPVLLKGLTTTLVVSLSAIALGLVLGVLLAFGLTSRYRLVRWPCGLYRSFWRGTPILLQLLLVYYLLPEIGIEIDIGIKIKMPQMNRYQTGVNPVGDIDIVISQKGFDRAAQKG